MHFSKVRSWWSNGLYDHVRTRKGAEKSTWETAHNERDDRNSKATDARRDKLVPPRRPRRRRGLRAQSSALVLERRLGRAASWGSHLAFRHMLSRRGPSFRNQLVNCAGRAPEVAINHADRGVQCHDL